MTSDLRRAAAAWAADDPDPATRAEVERLLAAPDADADAELAERFGTRLQFGTAGLRGKLGAGPNRMNRALVRRAAAGLARWLQAGNATAGVVIGFDARHLSAEFAADSAAVIAGAGLPARLLPRPLPTPVLAYATRTLPVDAGIMVTASHNPAQYNGYKVYLGDGAQIVPPVDREISAEIGRVGSLAEVVLAAPGDPLIEMLDEGIVERYVEEAHRMLVGVRGPGAGGDRSLAGSAARLRIVYTPLHGVGGALATRMLARAGFDDLSPVAAQFAPDPDFPTVDFPNPEEPGALDLALAEAAQVGADLVLANDPDADRLGAAIPSGGGPGGAGGWRKLTGDELGVLLADHLLRRSTGADLLVVTSIVSSTQLSKMAAAVGVHFIETLTGFKWLARSADAHPDWRFLFGYEEALGYCVGTLVRDKDGLTAAVLLAEVVAELHAEGRTVEERLDELSAQFGAHVTRQWSITLSGADGPRRMEGLISRLRTEPPEQLDGMAVTATVDLLKGSGGRGLPPTTGVILRLGPDRRVIVRPSGTEPKLKMYFQVVEQVEQTERAEGAEQARNRAAAQIDRLQAAMAALVSS